MSFSKINKIKEHYFGYVIYINPNVIYWLARD